MNQVSISLRYMSKIELLARLVTDLTILINIKHSYNKHTCVIYRHVSHVKVRLRIIGSSTWTRTIRIFTTIKIVQPINYTRCETRRGWPFIFSFLPLQSLIHVWRIFYYYRPSNRSSPNYLDATRTSRLTYHTIVKLFASPIYDTIYFNINILTFR